MLSGRRGENQAVGHCKDDRDAKQVKRNLGEERVWHRFGDLVISEPGRGFRRSLLKRMKLFEAIC
jgi:hypothetical protein